MATSFHAIVLLLTSLLQGQTTEDFVIATARREIACIMALQEFPRPQGLFYGPGQYRPTSTSKLSALTNYLKVAQYLLNSYLLR